MHEQLKCYQLCLIAKIGIAIDYHYFMTEHEYDFRKKDLIKKGFEIL
jgi:hypothetical protein